MNWDKVANFLTERGMNEMKEGYDYQAPPHKYQTGRMLYLLGLALKIGLEKENETSRTESKK